MKSIILEDASSRWSSEIRKTKRAASVGEIEEMGARIDGMSRDIRDYALEL